ncbi:hypothetical protein Tco_1570036 [Tanacetum coccineum]
MEAGSKIVHQCYTGYFTFIWKVHNSRDTLTPNLTENSPLSLQKSSTYIYQWAEKTVPVAEGSSETTIERYMENYKNVSQDIRDQMNAEAEAVQIILTGIDNDIYSTVDACPNACEMWKAIESLPRKQGKAIVTSSAPTYDPEPATVTEDEEMSKEKEIDKLMALISLSFKKIYKPTNNNLRINIKTSQQIKIILQ